MLHRHLACSDGGEWDDGEGQSGRENGPAGKPRRGDFLHPKDGLKSLQKTAAQIPHTGRS